MQAFCSTEFLILRKSVFGEAGLVLAGLSPEAGQLHVLWKGARRLGRQQFPAADLFRRIRLEYREGSGELVSWRGGELLQDHSRVATDYAAYEAACRLARFALANTHAGAASPRFFLALNQAFARLATAGGAATPVAFCGAVALFLAEQGWMDGFAANPGRAANLQAILDMGLGAPPPPFPLEQWQRIEEWLIHQLQQHDCRLP